MAWFWLCFPLLYLVLPVFHTSPPPHCGPLPYLTVIGSPFPFVIAGPSLLVILNGVKNLPPAQGELRVAISVLRGFSLMPLYVSVIASPDLSGRGNLCSARLQPRARNPPLKACPERRRSACPELAEGIRGVRGVTKEAPPFVSLRAPTCRGVAISENASEVVPKKERSFALETRNRREMRRLCRWH